MAMKLTNVSALNVLEEEKKKEIRRGRGREDEK